MTGQILHCVGCGHAIAEDRPGRFLAISCGFCGAGSPFLETGGLLVSHPASMIRLLLDYTNGTLKNPPHLEYYLGYSDHESEPNTMVRRTLGHLGCLPQRECEQIQCRQAYALGVLNWLTNVRGGADLAFINALLADSVAWRRRSPEMDDPGYPAFIESLTEKADRLHQPWLEATNEPE